METPGSSDTLVHIYQIIRCYFPEDGYLYNHCLEGLKCDWLSVSLMCFLRDINSNYMLCFSESSFIDVSRFTFWRGDGKLGDKSFLYLPPFYLQQYNSTFTSSVLFTGSLCLLNMHHFTPTSAITSTSTCHVCSYLSHLFSFRIIFILIIKTL